MKRFFIVLTYLFIGYTVFAQTDSAYVREHYEKIEKQITMRDGIKLFTAIYVPKDKSKKYPILLNRTPYTVAPYGSNQYKTSLGNFPEMMYEGFIFVYQDVRGKWMSEGDFDDLRPQVTHKTKKDTDESTDAFDTIDWLVKNVPNNNGRVGMYGVSYPGFYAAAALVNAHAALKAVSPQAPAIDWFIGDDFHRNGALFVMDAFRFMSTFGVNRPVPITPDKGPKALKLPVRDGYQFYLNHTLKDLKQTYFGDNIRFWNNLFIHPDRDSYWKNRVILPYLKQVKPAVLVVGGFFDAEDVYGTFATYRTLRDQSPATPCFFAVGPWFHGGWVRSDGDFFGDLSFGRKTALDYRQNFELPFFKYYLKEEGSLDMAKVNVFFSGSNEWHKFEVWPPDNMGKRKLYFHANGKLSFDKPVEEEGADEYLSDPNKPIPFQEGIIENRKAEYMVADQRFVGNRPDVMVYQTEILTEDVTLAGPLSANLKVSVTGTDADFVVKLIDVLPEKEPKPMHVAKSTVMGGYQMLIRGDIFRGKYRNSFEYPKAFVPNEIEEVKFQIPDIGHTFKKGHRIMVQVQSTWFPLADRNPQKFMNIYEALKEDFKKEKHSLYRNIKNASYIELPVLN